MGSNPTVSAILYEKTIYFQSYGIQITQSVLQKVLQSDGACPLNKVLYQAEPALLDAIDRFKGSMASAACGTPEA